MEQKTLLVLGASSEVGRKLIEAVYEDYGLIYAHYGHNDEKLKEFFLRSETRQACSLTTPIFFPTAFNGAGCFLFVIDL